MTIQGEKILFDVENLGEFSSICQVCDGERPANTLIIDLKFEDGKTVSFPVICNCGYGGFVKAQDGSCLCCFKCLMIVAKPTQQGAFANVKGARWAL